MAAVAKKALVEQRKLLVVMTIKMILAFNRYQMSTPSYREMARMAEMKMSISRQTLINWYGKIADKLTKLVPALKDEALCENANVNVDETWCRYQTRFGHKKHYMWCIANKAAKTVIFFYDEGKRNRNVLRDFLGNAKINSLQSDGYNVYMYLDNELNDIEHLCCMAHVRAKFKYAYEQGMDERAKYFLDKIGWLYNEERIYLSPMTVERKNSLFFCSTDGAKTSAIFHTIIEICKLFGVSARDYINRFLNKVSLGRTDWQNLTPAKQYQQY